MTQLSTIVGVVDPSDEPGARGLGEDLWRMSFTLIRWRDSEGVIQESSLRIEKTVSHRQLKRYQKRIEGYQLRQLRVRFLSATVAELIALSEGAVDDAELRRYADKLQEPVIIADPILGELRLDRRMQCFDVNVLWCGQTVTFSLDADKGNTISGDALACAHALWQDRESWNERVLKQASDDLLEIKNDNWLDEDEEGEEEEPLTAEQFQNRMRLTNITVSPGGDLSFWFDDGFLFFGHTIAVEATLTEGPSEASFMG